MRFMLLIFPGAAERGGTGASPGAEGAAAMMRYDRELQLAGVLLAVDRLHPPTTAAHLSFTGGRPATVGGPFVEVPKAVGGYWMIQVKSVEEAMLWASRCPASEGEVIEVRQVRDSADSPPARPGMVDGFARLPSSSP